MDLRASRVFAIAKSFFRTFWALPAFLVLSIIPWLLAAHAFTLSRYFYDADRDSIGVAFKIAAIGIVVLTALVTFWFIVVWIWMLVRSIRGLETEQ